MRARSLAVGLLAVALTAGTGCGPPEQALRRRRDKLGVPIEIRTVEARDVDFAAAKVGVLRADKQVQLNFSLPGTFGAYLVEENTEVTKGQAIARLDVAPFKSKLREAELKLNELKKHRARVERFYRKQLATQVEYDMIVTGCKQAQRQVNALREMLDKVVLRAPMAGLLLRKLAQPGNTVPPGVPVALLVGLRPLKTDLEFSDADRQHIPLGKQVVVTCAALPNKTFTGHLSRKNPSIDPRSQLTQVEVIVENQEGLLKPGMMVETKITTTRRRRAVSVPIDTIVYDGDELCVFVYDRETSEARRRKVTVGKFHTTYVIIERGLEAGERLIVRGLGFVRDRSPVRVVEAPKSDDEP